MRPTHEETEAELGEATVGCSNLEHTKETSSYIASGFLVVYKMKNLIYNLNILNYLQPKKN